jgi:predicted ATP-grasp superfamily ATP-dependent carboligase
MNKKNPAVVLGMFETGLGVARSLGEKGILVHGFDFKKDIGFYSRYVEAQLCPYPLEKAGQ